MRAFANLAERWNIPKAHWPAMLGRSSPNTIRAWMRELKPPSGSDAPLDPDVRERLSHLVAIYDGLHRLFGDGEYADAWVRLPNRAFGGEAPLVRITSGRFADLYEVRAYVERALAD